MKIDIQQFLLHLDSRLPARKRKLLTSCLFSVAAIVFIFGYSLLFSGLTTQVNASMITSLSQGRTAGANSLVFSSGNKHDSTITIGFIGDSLTYGASAINPATDAAPIKAASYLGPGFAAVNRGISGQTTASWANNNCSRSPRTCLTDAISAFQQANVDVVHIMLGTNDTAISRRVSPVTYYNNLQRIIDQLKAAGFKYVILARPIYFGLEKNNNRDQQSLNTLTSGYYQALQALVATNHGFVLMGDTQAYEWFKNHYDYVGTAGTYYDDSLHPTSLGYDRLGGFWASGIKKALLTTTTSALTLLQNNSGFSRW